MGSTGRNINGKIAEIRDYFLGCESDLLDLLLQKEENVNKIYQYSRMSFSEVLAKIKALIEAMETGYIRDKNNKLVELNEELCSKIEKQLVLLMASIEDLEYVQILEKIPVKEDLDREL